MNSPEQWSTQAKTCAGRDMVFLFRPNGELALATGTGNGSILSAAVVGAVFGTFAANEETR